MGYLPTDYRVMNAMTATIFDFAQKFEDREVRNHYIRLGHKCAQLAWEFFDLGFDLID